jgi:hypothetical protein
MPDFIQKRFLKILLDKPLFVCYNLLYKIEKEKVMFERIWIVITWLSLVGLLVFVWLDNKVALYILITYLVFVGIISDIVIRMLVKFTKLSNDLSSIVNEILEDLVKERMK